MKADVFIPSVFKDLNKVEFVVNQLVKHCPDIADIHICMPDKTGTTEHEVEGHKIIYHNDFDVLTPMKEFIRFIRFRPNWIHQQLLKLCQRVTKTEYYYVIDADIMPTRELRLERNGKPVLFTRTNPRDEMAFNRFIAKATGGDLATWSEEEYAETKFISDMQLFKREWVDEMIMRYFHSAEEFMLFTCMNTYWRNTPNARRDSIFISEYIMYSLYVEKYHGKEVEVVYADTKQIDKGQFSQMAQTFGKDEIEAELKETERLERGFLKLQSNCGMSDVKYAV